jgi:hypothetical protein
MLRDTEKLPFSKLAQNTNEEARRNSTNQLDAKCKLLVDVYGDIPLLIGTYYALRCRLGKPPPFGPVQNVAF